MRKTRRTIINLIDMKKLIVLVALAVIAHSLNDFVFYFLRGLGISMDVAWMLTFTTYGVPLFIVLATPVVIIWDVLEAKVTHHKLITDIEYFKEGEYSNEQFDAVMDRLCKDTGLTRFLAVGEVSKTFKITHGENGYTLAKKKI
jgi:hypothetical protein